MTKFKNNSVHFRCSDDDLKIIKRNAQSRKLSTSVFIRSACMNDIAGGSMVSEELSKIRNEINSIGVNINQIAKRSNQGDSVDISGLHSVVDEIQRDINDVLRKIR